MVGPPGLNSSLLAHHSAVLSLLKSVLTPKTLVKIPDNPKTDVVPSPIQGFSSSQIPFLAVHEPLLVLVLANFSQFSENDDDCPAYNNDTGLVDGVYCISDEGLDINYDEPVTRWTKTERELFGASLNDDWKFFRLKTV